MAVTNFIPEIWSAKMFKDYDKALVFGQVVNRDYEGEISQYGDTVRINAIGPCTVNDYTRNSTSDLTYEVPTGAQTVLTIDQSKYTGVLVDDLDQAQTNPKIMAEVTRKMGVAFAESADYAISGLYTDAGATVASTACGPTAVTDLIGQVGKKLSENDVPRDGRFMVVPPWFTKIMAEAEILKWIGMPAQGAPGGAAADGYVGRALGFDFYESNNLRESTASGSTARQHYIMAGTRDAISFASQISQVEGMRSQRAFGDIVRALNLYGMKVVQPKALVTCNFVESTV